MAIIDEINALKKQPQQQSTWVQDLIKQVYKPEEEQFQQKQPIGFNFKRDPFDSTSYYKQLGTNEGINTAASNVVYQVAANKKAAEQQRLLEEQQKALQGINPQFTYDSNFTPNGKSRKYGLKSITPNTSKAADYWGSKYGIKTVGGYREHGSVPGSDHPKGRALDFMINNIKNGHSTGDALANDIIKNYKAWDVSYVIWNRYIWSPSRGWRKYNGPSPHTDHVHVSFNS